MKEGTIVNYLKLKRCLFFLTVGLAVSCQTDGEAALRSDPSASQTINQANIFLQNNQKLSTEQFDKVKKLYEQYPTSKAAKDTYRAALIRNGDWAILADFLKQIPDAELTVQDRLNLAKANIKLGRYTDAAETLTPLAGQNNFEAKTLLASAYFHLGKYDESKKLFDENWQQILNEKKSDEITLRGMIYFYQGDHPKAIETLDQSIAFNPEHVPSYNGLSRVYAAQGEHAKAEENLKRVQELFDQVTAIEIRQTKLVEKIYKLQEAYQAKRFQEVIDLANEILPQTDAKNKVALYQFLYNSYQALGKQREAQEVLLQAKQTQQ